MSVAQDVVHPVRIELTANNVLKKKKIRGAIDDRPYVIWVHPIAFENGVNFGGGSPDQLGSPLRVIGLPFERAFDHVRKGPVPNVVQECRRLERSFVCRENANFRWTVAVAAFKGLDNPLRKIQYAQAVIEPGMLGPGVSQATNSQLANPPQTLELQRIQQLQQERVFLIDTYEVVDRVTKNLTPLVDLDAHLFTVGKQAA
jgi:hypothetical protein